MSRLILGSFPNSCLGTPVLETPDSNQRHKRRRPPYSKQELREGAFPNGSLGTRRRLAPHLAFLQEGTHFVERVRRLPPMQDRMTIRTYWPQILNGIDLILGPN